MHPLPVHALLTLCLLCSLPFQFVEDPYTKARFQPECEGQVSPVGDVARIGLEASGLVSFPGQQR